MPNPYQLTIYQSYCLVHNTTHTKIKWPDHGLNNWPLGSGVFTYVTTKDQQVYSRAIVSYSKNSFTVAGKIIGDNVEYEQKKCSGKHGQKYEITLNEYHLHPMGQGVISWLFDQVVNTHVQDREEDDEDGDEYVCEEAMHEGSIAVWHEFYPGRDAYMDLTGVSGWWD